MTFNGDPFRVLGVQSGATEAEIKRAYRALAKRYHPDSAGEKALPRFLAIQAAYDMLTAPGGRARARTASRTTPPAGPPTPPGQSAPRGAKQSEADAERTRATREAFRRARARPAPGTTGPTGGPAWWAAGARAKPGPDTPNGDPAAGPTDAWSAGPTGTDPGPTPRGRRRGPRMATMGSTSYDDAPHDPEPNWNGASWYGDSSGTYWTINPKEYADPRKHGPEYLARARRRAQADPTGAIDDDFGTPAGSGPGRRNDASAGPTAQPPPSQPASQPPPRGPAGPTAGPWQPGTQTAADAGFEATASWSTTAAGGSGRTGPGATTAGGSGFAFESPPGGAPRGGPAGGAPRRPATGPTGARPAPAPGRAAAGATAGATAKAGAAAGAGAAASAGAGIPYTAPPVDGRRRGDSAGGGGGGGGGDNPSRPLDAAISQRLVVALIAWPPLGLAAGALIGELTGCGRYAATCTDPEPFLGWLVQPAILGVLLLFPVLARPAAVAAMTTGIGAIIGGVVLSILGGTRVPAAASSLLLAILLMSYAIGLIGAMSGRLPLPAWLRADPDES